jgi:hypothetical protein
MKNIIATVGALALALTLPPHAAAHCDTLDGPVVQAGQRALATGDLQAALVWVAPEAEAELRPAFASAREVRALGPAGRALADRYFFETLVRLHRAGEGEPYTGLKAAGTTEPIIRQADEALASGSIHSLAHVLSSSIHEGLQMRFAAVLEARTAAARAGDVESGRAAVAAYVRFMEYLERVHDSGHSRP